MMEFSSSLVTTMVATIALSSSGCSAFSPASQRCPDVECAEGFYCSNKNSWNQCISCSSGCYPDQLVTSSGVEKTCQQVCPEKWECLTDGDCEGDSSFCDTRVSGRQTCETCERLCLRNFRSYDMTRCPQDCCDWKLEIPREDLLVRDDPPRFFDVRLCPESRIDKLYGVLHPPVDDVNDDNDIPAEQFMSNASAFCEEPRPVDDGVLRISCVDAFDSNCTDNAFAIIGTVLGEDGTVTYEYYNDPMVIGCVQLLEVEIDRKKAFRSPPNLLYSLGIAIVATIPALSGYFVSRHPEAKPPDIRYHVSVVAKFAESFSQGVLFTTGFELYKEAVENSQGDPTTEVQLLSGSLPYGFLLLLATDSIEFLMDVFFLFVAGFLFGGFAYTDMNKSAENVRADVSLGYKPVLDDGDRGASRVVVACSGSCAQRLLLLTIVFFFLPLTVYFNIFALDTYFTEEYNPFSKDAEISTRVLMAGALGCLILGSCNGCIMCVGILGKDVELIGAGALPKWKFYKLFAIDLVGLLSAASFGSFVAVFFGIELIYDVLPLVEGAISKSNGGD